jgi:hypothetical protein
VLFLFGAVQSRAKWPVQPQLKQTLPELDPAVGGAGRCITGDSGGRAFGATSGTDVEVGGKPMTAASASADTAGKWGEEDDTPSGTSVGHC